jgi:hypothetical protein|tara:strand:+ start:1503 stop:1772 length:270 start_codon:yes stop_codon:yes gene_type:complete
MAFGTPYWINIFKKEDWGEVEQVKVVRGQKNSTGVVFEREAIISVNLESDRTSLGSLTKEKLYEWAETKIDMTILDKDIATDLPPPEDA